jgi:hypothetical protein
VANVVLEIEVGIVDPQRSPGVERRRRQLLPVPGHQVQTAANVVEYVGELWRRPLEQEHRADVHVRLRSLLMKEGSIDGCESV